MNVWIIRTPTGANSYPVKFSISRTPMTLPTVKGPGTPGKRTVRRATLLGMTKSPTSSSFGWLTARADEATAAHEPQDLSLLLDVIEDQGLAGVKLKQLHVTRDRGRCHFVVSNNEGERRAPQGDRLQQQGMRHAEFEWFMRSDRCRQGSHGEVRRSEGPRR